MTACMKTCSYIARVCVCVCVMVILELKGVCARIGGGFFLVGGGV